MSAYADLCSMLGIPDPDTQAAFENELLLFANAACGVLYQLGVDKNGSVCVMTNNNTWDDLFGEQNPTVISLCKLYIHMKVKVTWDRESMNTSGVKAFEELIKEMEWRIRVAAEEGN